MWLLYFHIIHDIHFLFEKAFFKFLIELAQIHVIGGVKKEKNSEFQIFIFFHFGIFYLGGPAIQEKKLVWPYHETNKQT